MKSKFAAKIREKGEKGEKKETKEEKEEGEKRTASPFHRCLPFPVVSSSSFFLIFTPG
ncbi:hypothetical protein [Flavihumibacter sp. UBA7668]|uniref:hypothetical protein n=1 Tax=Flavihumibacter sp. UBA7668 TaxID=1946542 RepID=UPI0025C0EED0|nr:hypothetical protein [Flavihumibacter sp. UBA7668]